MMRRFLEHNIEGFALLLATPFVGLLVVGLAITGARITVERDFSKDNNRLWVW